MNMKAIFSVAIWPKIFLHQAIMKKKNQQHFHSQNKSSLFQVPKSIHNGIYNFIFLYVDNNKILHMNTLLICLPKEKKSVDFD